MACWVLAFALLVGAGVRTCAEPFQAGEVLIRQVYVYRGSLTSERQERVRRHMGISAEYARSVFQQIGISIRLTTPALFVSADSQGMPLPIGMTESDAARLLEWYDHEHGTAGVIPAFYVDHLSGNPPGAAYPERKAAMLGAPVPGVMIDHPANGLESWRWEFSADVLAHELGHVLLNKLRFTPSGSDDVHLPRAEALMGSGGPPVPRRTPAYAAAFVLDGSMDVIDFEWVWAGSGETGVSQVEGFYTASSLVQASSNRGWGVTVQLGHYVAIDPSPSPPAAVSVRYEADASGLVFGARLEAAIVKTIQELQAGVPDPVTRTERTGVSVHLSAWSRRQTPWTIEVCLDTVFPGLAATQPGPGFKPVAVSSFADPVSVSLEGIPDAPSPTDTHVYIQAPSGNLRELAPAEYAVVGLKALVVDKSQLAEGGVLRWTFAVPDTAAAGVFGGDMNNDGAFNLHDILWLSSHLGKDSSPYDMTGDGRVNLDDVNELVRARVRAKLGDVDLNGTVDQQDLEVLKIHWLEAGNWAVGDFDGDRVVSETDLAILSANWDAAPTQWQGYPIGRKLEVPSTTRVTSALNLRWDALAGVLYQVQSAMDLRQWSDEGGPVVGAGASFSQWVPVSADTAQFYRLKATGNASPSLDAGAVSQTLVVTWASAAGTRYRVQRWVPPKAAEESTWADVGDPIPGDGTLLTALVPIGAGDAAAAGCRVLIVP